MKNALLSLSKKLISVESTAEQPEQLDVVIDVAQRELKQNQLLHIKRFKWNDKPSLVATVGDSKTPEIMLHGHLDVVPGHVNQFSASVKNGHLVGRGAADMKASCAVLILLLKNADKSLKGKLGLMLTTDEEIGGHNGAKTLSEKGYRPQCFITGEPTNLEPVTKAKGVIWLKLISAGDTAHGAYPWKGQNAIPPLAKSIVNIYQKFPPPVKEVWATTVSVTKLDGGSARNQIPEEADATLDIRYIPTDNPHAVIKKIKSCLESGVKLDTLMVEPPTITKPNNICLTKLSKIIVSQTGQVKTRHTHGSSDARFFSALGIPAFEFGPTGHGLHSDHEYVEIDSLTTYYKILKDFTHHV